MTHNISDMRPFPLASVLVLPLLLAACAAMPTRADREALAARFVGGTEAQLVTGLGLPSRVFTTGTHRFLAYAEATTQMVAVPGGGWGGPWGGPWGWGPGWYGPAAVPVTSLGCETAFEVVGGTVRGFTVHGPYCG